MTMFYLLISPKHLVHGRYSKVVDKLIILNRQLLEASDHEEEVSNK